MQSSVEVASDMGAGSWMMSSGVTRMMEERPRSLRI